MSSPAPATASLAQVDWAGKNYLVVDDFIGIRQLLRESLRNLGARNIDQASSGGEAIAMLSRIRYDVVLCDYNLGEGKNGQQVLEEARVRNLLLPSSVWMMVSAEKSVESVIGAAEHQPDAYLIKPITEGVLLTRLNRVWHKKQVFRMIDLAYAEKDYLRAARLCDARIEVDKVHRIELLRMKASLALICGEPEQARRPTSASCRGANTSGRVAGWPRSAWRTANSSRRARFSRAPSPTTATTSTPTTSWRWPTSSWASRKRPAACSSGRRGCRPIRCCASAAWARSASSWAISAWPRRLSANASRSASIRS
jgi:CheY-like chemotaxis protein